MAQRTLAHNSKLYTCSKLHEGLCKAESSLAIQLQTEKIGFAAFFYKRRVPGVLSLVCQCGWRRQDLKHVIIFCPGHVLARGRLFEEAGTRQYSEMLSKEKSLKVVARWAMREGLLHQFSLAKEQMDRAEKGAAEEENAGEDEEPKGGDNQEPELEPEMAGAERLPEERRH